MSYLDVNVLRRFTQKLAAAATAPEELTFPEPKKAPSVATGIEQARHKGLAVQNSMLGKTMGGLRQAQEGITDAGSRALEGLKGMDAKTLGYGAGGAAIGGAGAIALANLLRSKDDEEQGTPWLAGLAGAGVGGGLASAYGPQVATALGKLMSGNKDAAGAAGAVAARERGQRII